MVCDNADLKMVNTHMSEDNKPDEEPGICMSSHLTIIDAESGEVLVNIRADD
jgi:hypothetical protein